MANYFILAQGQTGAVQTAAPKTAAQITAASEQKPAAGQPKGPQGLFGDGFGSMGIMIIVIAAMFFLMWRGQSKERKKREEMLSSLKKGDRILTIGGMFATIAEVKENSYMVDLSDKVRIEISKNAIGSVVVPEGTAEKK